MKRPRIFAAVFAVATLLSGCTSLSLNGHDILSPPRAAGDRADIQQMIEDDAGGSYELLYPAAGDYKSGMMMRDLDGDGTDEAVVLYTAAQGEAKLLTAKKQGDSYKSLGAGKLPSANIGSMRFADVDADGVEEILISCDPGLPAASLTAYFPRSSLILPDVARGFTDFLTGDFDGNKAEDVLLLRPATAEAAAMAELWTYESDDFSLLSSCETDPTAASYPSLCFAEIGGGLQGAVADSVTADGKYSTQLIFYDNAASALMNPLFLSSSYASYGRTSPLLSRDIDDDGVIEFPLCSLSAHGVKEDISHVCAMAQWSCYDPAELNPVPKRGSVLCEPLNFLLVLSDSTALNVTARYDGENTFTLHALNYKGSEAQPGEVLLTVKRYENGDFDSSTVPEAVLYENGSDVYTYIPGEKCPLSDNDIKNSFMLIN